MGTEPDPRFTFANERTFLAWIRTGLGFVAGGVAVTALGTLGTPLGQELRIVSLLLIVCGLASGPTAFIRWARNERALRQEQPLPSTRLLPLLPIGIVVVAVVSIAAAIVG
jgi:putative membrane protein